MPRLKDKEPTRLAACIIWLEDLLKLENVSNNTEAFVRLYSYLDNLHVQCALSPLHDKDTYTAEDVRNWVDKRIDPDYYQFISEDIQEVRKLAPKVGDSKKAHYHLEFKFPGPKTREHLTALMDPLLHIPVSKWEKVLDWDGYTRYLAHLDNVDKHHYSAFDITAFAGVDLSMLLRSKQTTNIRRLCEINQYIRDNKIEYYYQLDDWAYDTGDMDTIALVTGRASYYASKFRSKREHKAAIAAAKKAQEQRDSQQ